MFAVVIAIIATGRGLTTLDNGGWFIDNKTTTTTTPAVTTSPPVTTVAPQTVTPFETTAPPPETEIPETTTPPPTAPPQTTSPPPPVTPSNTFSLPSAFADEYDNEWAFFLINKDNPIPENYSFSTRIVSGDYRFDSRAADYAIQMLADAKADGVDLLIVSAYRTVERQRENYNREVRKYIDAGYTEADAHFRTSQEIAPPGASEHNAGLALDILDRSANLSESFDRTKEFAWLAENSWRYGFILRYPKGKTHITGIIYEPWHYRFVGVKRAYEITQSGLCLEEFFESLNVPEPEPPVSLHEPPVSLREPDVGGGVLDAPPDEISDIDNWDVT